MMVAEIEIAPEMEIQENASRRTVTFYHHV